jgi:Ca-activated chloride channel family protein
MLYRRLLPCFLNRQGARTPRKGKVLTWRLGVLAVAIFFFCILSAAQSGYSYKGTKIVEVLRKFQQQGMKINFSSRLVTPDMIVVQEPKTISARTILDEVLNPYNLQILEGPGKIYLVVKKRKGVEADQNPNGISEIAEQLDVPFVTIYIGAQGSNDRFITTLQPKDFILKEDGAEQEISEFTNLSDASNDQEPLSILLLIDQSSSMSDLHSAVRKYDFIRMAALKFLEQLQSQDRVMISGFNQSFWRLSELTQDQELIRERLKQEPELKNRTALIDLLPEAIQQMKNFPNRKILLICSDGQDSASHTTVEELSHFLQSSDVTVFAIGSESPAGSADWGHSVLERITAATGGYAFFASSASDLSLSINKIRTAIGSQYAIGYVPRYPNLHKWRDIRVDCKIPGIRLRYRNRYLF